LEEKIKLKSNIFKTFIKKIIIQLRLDWKDLFQHHLHLLEQKINASVNIHHHELEDFTIEAVYIKSGDDNKIEFYVVCNCNLNYKYAKYHDKYKNRDK